MLVKLLFILSFVRLVWALTNVTAVYGDNRIITTGVWTKADTDCGYSTSTMNSTVSLTFNGVSIHVLGGLSRYGGIVRITLDDQPPRLIDLHGASCGQLLFSNTGLANGQHSISLKLTEGSPNITDGPARLFVFKSFIWSELAPNPSSLSPSRHWVSVWKRQSSAPPPPPPPAAPPTTPPTVPTTPPTVPTTPPTVPTTPPTVPTTPPTVPTTPPTVPTTPPSVPTTPLTVPTTPLSVPTTPLSVPTSTSSVPSSSSSSSSPSSSSTSRSSSSSSTSRSSSSSSTSRSSSSSSTSRLSSSSSSSSSRLSSLPSSSTRSSSLSSPRPQTNPSSSKSSPLLDPPTTRSSSSAYKPSKHPIPPTSTLPPVPTVTAVASGPTPDLSGVVQLWTCKPYGSNDCVFNPQVADSQDRTDTNTYSLIVGTPASNCGGTSNSEVVVGGQLTISDTWSQDRTVGLSLGTAADDLVLNTSGTQVWENSRSQHLSKVVRMTIPPERQGALVAQVTYTSTNGTLQIGNETPFSVIANQPGNDVEYLANIVPCEAQFNGNFTPQLETASSSGTQSMKPYSHAIVVIVALTVRILL